VTKSELLATLANDTGLKKKDVDNVMQALRNTIYKTLKKEHKIKLDGLGVFQLKDRKARVARNPRTGEMVNVPAKKVVKFRVLKDLKEADLGISVIISGLMADVHDCCSVAGVKPHTCETSLGVWGNTDRLPDEDILRFTTMCGHGQVPFNLVNKIVEDVKEGKLTLPEAGRELAKPCQCGVFNPARAAAMVEEIMCLWGIHIV